MKQQLYEMLRSQAIADQKKALLSLDLLADHPAGIGDHSTEDYWTNVDMALDTLVDAEDRIEIIQKYFIYPPQEVVDAPY
ncbi:MAG TPA: hypothetical protein DEG69_19380 [Flavobacteriaceae bacterium]|nr:hypothetical protein [Flavobacteriaceae bacterium]